MKTLHAILFFVVLMGAGLAAQSAEVWLATVSPTSGASAVSSSLPGGVERFAACNSAARYRLCPTSSCTATSTDFPLAAGLVWPVQFRGSDHYIAFYGDGAGATCNVYDEDPQPRQ